MRLKGSKIIDYNEKFFKQKLYKIKFPTKKLKRRMSLSRPRVELGGTHGLPFLK